jgi:NAD(P)-dependent dehydrogenase (short-subunit alcohol dehydrogenase family)
MKKSILITGSTDGIGKLTALKMVQGDHQLYLHGRNPDKLDAVIAEIRKETGHQNIEGFVADFSDLNAVQKMADEINAKVTTLDVLINNAGVFKSPKTLNRDGIDIRMVVNYLAPYLLTYSIKDKLKKSTEPRIINLSSAAQSSVSLELLEGKVKVSDQEAYAQSKLALLMWSFHLALQEPQIATVALNPGSLLNTNMAREAYGKFWSSAEKGANIIYDLALVTKANQMNGKYFDNDRGEFGNAHPDAYDASLVDALIEKTNGILKVAN